MSSTASGVTVIYVQDANINANPVNLSSAIVDLNHVLRRRIIEHIRSTDAVVTGKVTRTLSSNLMLALLFVHYSKASTALLAVNFPMRYFSRQPLLSQL